MADRLRSVLPIPQRRRVGVTTYDAKAPGTSFPPIVPPDVTAEAKEASGALVRMAGTSRSWRLDPSGRNQLVGQIACVANGLGQDNRLGAEALFGAWR